MLVREVVIVLKHGTMRIEAGIFGDSLSSRTPSELSRGVTRKPEASAVSKPPKRKWKTKKKWSLLHVALAESNRRPVTQRIS